MAQDPVRQASGRPRLPLLRPLPAALLYAAGSALWILLSDRLLAAWFERSGGFALASALKGWLFTAVTAVLLYAALRRRMGAGTAMAAGPEQNRPVPMWQLALAAAAVVALTLWAVGFSVDRRQGIEVERLRAVAELKRQQLGDWLAERHIDVRLLVAGTQAVERFHATRAATAAGEREAWLDRVMQMLPLTRFQSATLLDERGALLWHSSAGGLAVGEATRRELQRAAGGHTITRVGPYRDAAGHLHTDFAVPLRLPSQAGGPAPLLLLHADDEQYLPADFNRWPMPSSTGEVVLARREGDVVVYLNALRKRPDAALNLRVPFGAPLLVSQLMAQPGDAPSQLQGQGYDGERAFGVGVRVPDTDWVLLAKMDRDELTEAAVAEALWILLAGSLAVFIAGSVVYLLRQRRQLALAQQVQAAQNERLQALELLSAVAEASDDAIFAKDTHSRYTLFNRAAARLAGRPAQEVIGLDDRALFPPEQAEHVMAADREVMRSAAPVLAENTLDTALGRRIFLVAKGALRDRDGQVIGLFGISRDVTQVRADEAALRRAHRALETSRECGQALIRAQDEAQLLHEVCRILVDRGGYRLAWIGFALDDAERSVRPVAQAGDGEDYVQSLQVSWADGEHGRGPTGTAIRERRAVAIRHIDTDPDFAPWRQAARERGYTASAAVPLMADGQTCFGALCLYAAEAAAFDDEELRLVGELAADIGYGVRALRDRAALQQAQLRLREQAERLAESQHIARVGSWEVDWPTQAMRWSEEAFRLHGLAPGSAQPPLSEHSRLVHPEDAERTRQWLLALAAGGTVGDAEFRVLPADGSPVRRLVARAHLERGALGQPLRVVGTVQDVTAERAAEAERMDQQARYRELFASNPHPMWVHDPQTLALLEVNDAAVALYGRTREQLLALRVGDLQLPWDEADRDAGGESAGRAAVAGLQMHRLADGRRIVVQLSSHELDFAGRAAVVVLVDDVTEQRRAESRLRLMARRAQALLALPDQADQRDERGFMQAALEQAEALTGSRVAVLLGVHDGGARCEILTWSHQAQAHAQAQAQPHGAASATATSAATESLGLWAEVVGQRRPVVINDAAELAVHGGLPGGHAPLRRLVALPVIEGGQVVMLLGAGNKAGDYDELDVETLQLLANDIWRLVQSRRAQQALAASEGNYRRLTEQVPAIIYRALPDEASTTTYISPAVATLGYTPQEWLADPGIWAASLHPDDHERVFETLASTRAAGGAVDVQYRMRARDGRWLHFHDKAELVHDDQGHVLCLQGLMLDVTERVHADEQLRKLDQAVEQSPICIVITNLRAEIEYVNAAFEATTGYRRDEVVGRNPRILRADDVRPGDHDGVWRELTQGRPWKGRFHNKRKDGSAYFEQAHIAPLRDAAGRITHYVGVTEDISDKLRAEEELQKYREGLEAMVDERTRELHQAKAAAEAASIAKSAFLANMSHEIRTPMNAIIGLSHLLQRDALTPRQSERLAKIDGAAMHLLGIITGILDLSKIESGKLQLELADFSLPALFDQVRSMLADRAQAKGVALQLDLGDTPGWLHGDATRLRQALLNYADNALKFTEHGRVVLRARVQAEDAAGLMLRLEVQDTGIGISEQDLPRLFRAFEQADATPTRRFGGTGLGLALTRRLAQLMGGDAGAGSRLGVGSTFWMTARLQLGRSAAPTEIHPHEVDLAAELRRRCGGRRVLLAEDDPINLEVATELLAAAGLEVACVGDGRQALQWLDDHRCDLVLMDVQMPVLDGWEATRQLRQRPGLERLPVLAMTANAFEEDRQASLAAGMNDFVAKPVDPDRLFATLLRWLPARAGLAPAAGVPQPTAAADLTRARAVLGEMEPLLARDDTAAGELFEAHRRLLSASLGQDMLELERQLEAFDYAAALRTLRRLLDGSAPDDGL